jgi:hypothetical protein
MQAEGVWRETGRSALAWRCAAALGGIAIWLWAGALPALAGPPGHPEDAGHELEGFNHPCGVAVDSKGDLYVASAGEKKIRIFDPSHKEELASIEDAHEPCGLAVNGKGELFVSEQALGHVVRYKPSAYPFAGTPVYGAAEPIDSSGKARGISIDRFDDNLYVAEGNRVAQYNSAGTPGINEVQRVFVSAAVTGGSFKLSFEAQETGPIPYNATHDQVKAALKGLSTIGAGNVSVSEGKTGARDHIVTFTGALAGTDVELLKGDESGLTGGEFAIIGVTNGFSGHIGEGELTNVTGVAAYTYKNGDEEADRYLFIADPAGAEPDRVDVFSGPDVRKLKLRRKITGPKAGENFSFGIEGAYLAVDPGNRNGEDKCTQIFGQACTAGHFLVYDDTHKVVDEFDASGEFLDQFTSETLGDAEPTAMTVDRSGGGGDGTIYVTAGAGAGGKLLAFAPLAAPSRAALPELSRELKKAERVATDSFGDVYVLAASGTIHVFAPGETGAVGEELKVGQKEKGIEDPNSPMEIAVDSTGKVYVLDGNVNGGTDETVTYYTPGAYPPKDGTKYERHEPPIAKGGPGGGWPSFCESPKILAINPSNDHVFISARCEKHQATHELNSAANGSGLLDGDFAGNLGLSSRSLAVNGANGDVDFVGTTGITVVNGAGSEVLARINGAGGPAGRFPSSPNPEIAIDQSNGHALFFGSPLGTAREYDASGGFVAEFAFDPPHKFAIEATTPAGIAIDNSGGPRDGTAYVAFDDEVSGSPDLWAFAPLSYGERPQAVTGTASGVGGGSATIHGTVNPRGFPATECKFEYETHDQYIADNKTFSSALVVPCAEALPSIGEGTLAVAVHAVVGALDPEERYCFRLVAKNQYGPSTGDGACFGPPLVTPKPGLPVLYTEATLRANIDPFGLPTEYHFEYGEKAGEYPHSTPMKTLSAESGTSDVQATVTGLEEGTTYHFRVVAGNEANMAVGPDQEFTMQERAKASQCENTEYRTGLSAGLPDCRAYELVTPANTNGNSPGSPTTGTSPPTKFNNWLVTPRGPGAGERVSYGTEGTLPGFAGNGFLDGYLARRAAGEHPSAGWTSELAGPTYAQAAPDFTHAIRQEGVSADQLYAFWEVDPAETFPGTLQKGSYLRTLAGAAVGCNPQPLQADFELVGCGSLGTDAKAESLYVSPAGAHVIFASSAHLEDEAAPAGTMALYDRAAGESAAHVVSLKPGGGAFGAGESASFVAASEGGSAVLFKVGSSLYLRRDGQTVAIAAGASTFAGISEDGQRVFYTATGSGDKPATLFACDVEAGPCVGGGSPAGLAKIAEGSIFVNVPADGSRAFFVSEEALAGVEANENGEEAEDEVPNLYAWDAASETISFASHLAPQDFGGEGFAGDFQVSLDRWTKAISHNSGDIGRAKSPTRSTPDGGVLVFQSHGQLTEYDNEGHGEIYRYDPAAVEGERLTCPSCDPSGASPSADAMLEIANIHTRIDAITAIANVTDDGEEVFFQSSDRLLPEDANEGVQDVYEWKANGAGGCERKGGCLALISSGQGEADSYLYGMSANGHDVFFRTPEKLVGADVPGSPSIYDARIDGGIPEPIPPSPCQGDACQGKGSAPPAVSSPASTGAGEGNEVAKPLAPCGKGRHRVKGRCVAIKHHKRRNHRGANQKRGGRK